MERSYESVGALTCRAVGPLAVRSDVALIFVAMSPRTLAMIYRRMSK